MEASLFPSRPVIIWFRDDLRLADNPALSAAAASGRPLLSVFVHDEKTEGLQPLARIMHRGRWVQRNILESRRIRLLKRIHAGSGAPTRHG